MEKPTIRIVSSSAKTKPYVEDIRKLRERIEAEGVRFEDVRRYDAVAQILIAFIKITGTILVNEILNALLGRKRMNPKDNVKIIVIDKYHFQFAGRSIEGY